MRIQDLVNAAIEDTRAGRFADAEKKLRRLLAEPLSDQDSGTLQGLLGVVYASAGAFTAAARELAQAAAKKPDDASIASNLCNCLTQNGQFDEAIAAGRNATALNTGFAAAHNNLGNALNAKGDHDGAIASFEHALRIEPGNAEFLNNLGVAYKDKGDLDNAVSRYRQALDIHPDFAEAHNNLGTALVATVALADAIACYRMAIRINPDFSEAHNNLGATLLAEGDLDGAIASAQRALEINPDFADAHITLGNALNTKGDLDSAAASYLRLLDTHPGNAELHNTLGLILEDKHDLAGAIAHYRQALAIQPEFAAAHQNLGNAQRATGALEDAVVSFQHALRIRPDDSETHTNLALTYTAMGRYEDALRSNDLADTPRSRSEALLCLYALERYDEIDTRVTENLERDKANIYRASVCDFIANQTGRVNRHPFCPAPLDFIHVGKLGAHVDDVDRFIQALSEDLKTVPTVWEPVSRTTRHGFQTHGNLFSHKKEYIAALEQIIKDEIATYYAKYKSTRYTMMEMWPQNFRITGWSVRLQKQGHQSPHIHSKGWLSGVIYLALVESENPEEGSIVFGKHAHTYPVRNEEYPTVKHRPEKGDLVFFPSSLYHHTIPIMKDGERLTVSFDLMPDG